MGDSSFDRIAQALVQQHQMMVALEEENRRLRQQLADLREGRGIFVEIHGQRIALARLAAPSSSSPASPTPVHATRKLDQTMIETPTAETTEIASEQPADATPVAEKAEATPTFLEEIMIDEFSAALTSPMAVWQGPTKPTKETEEEQKATLRRELMGSYLLE